MRVYVHTALFRETIWGLGTDVQFATWKDRIDNWEVIGCFAMTELGHSSFLRGSETTATYDRRTKEFTINSPTVTATKWWIGMAGQTATHTIALAQLIIDGKKLGLNWFIVPLRDSRTGHLLPNISAGDIGKKAGRNGLDNGWIQFHTARIPRENMLMRWASVSPEGDYSPPINEAISYATLIGERAIVSLGIAETVGQSVTIATRYGAQRLQGPQDEQILDYQTHYSTVVPIIAGVYACQIVGSWFFGEYREKQEKQTRGEFSPIEMMAVVQESHAVSAAIKAWIGWWGADAIEACRRTMGGHSYSSYNAVAGHQADFAVMTQGGGDNVVLAQQAARYLISNWKRVKQGKPILSDSLSFFQNADEILKTGARASPQFPDCSTQELLYSLCFLTCRLVDYSFTNLEQVDGKDPEKTWNSNLTETLDCSRAFAFFFFGSHFERLVQAIETTDHKARKSLLCLSRLFVLKALEREIGLLLEFGHIESSQARRIRRSVVSLCKEIRSDAIPLVDGLDFPDFMIKSPLGRFQSDPYTTYLDMLKRSRNGVGKVDYWDDLVAPLLNSKGREAKL